MHAPEVSLKRNIVLEIVELARRLGTAAAGWWPATAGRRPRRRRRTIVHLGPHVGAHVATAHAAARAEHLHAIGNDLSGIALLAFLVLPLARLQATFDVDLAALLEVLARDLGKSAEEGDAMPLGALLLRAGLVLPLIGGGDADVGDGLLERHLPRLTNRIRMDTIGPCSSSGKRKSSSIGWTNYKTSGRRFGLPRACVKSSPATSVTGEPVQGDVSELRVHFGPGYRLYFTRRANVIVVLLTAGDKSTQKRDIRRAIKIASEVGDDL